MSTIWSALVSLTLRSGPLTLTLFSPLTPASASSTLSLMYCEKLKTYHYLDLVPKGRDEGEGNGANWVRRHDEYGSRTAENASR
jgi:hypothetical protein